MNLAPADFRFLSAWVQGVDVRDAWDRYCSHRGPSDLRRIRTAVRSMLDQLAGIARRHGDPATAATLKRDPRRIAMPPLAGAAGSDVTKPRSSEPPTLDEFAATLDAPDFYSQAELLQLWTERFGKVAPPGGARARERPELRAAKRRARLVERQLDALRRLERLAASRPHPDDETSAWLDPRVVQRLHAVGILRLRDLIFYVGHAGYRWYRKVPRLGEEGARRLTRWLREHEPQLGVVALTSTMPVRALPAAARTPRQTAGIVPIERLQVPRTLSGADGLNRAPAARCKIGARNDYEAVQAWLELRRPVGETGNANTWRAYRKEAERFLLWSLFERRKPVSSLDAADCVEYRRFLAAPGVLWVGPKSAPRWSPRWRPFEGPLAPRSCRMAEVVVDSLCTWLVDVRYLDSNPWAQVPKANRRIDLGDVRSLSDDEWRLVDRWLQALASTPANVRLAFVMRLALLTGLREAELSAARANWLMQDTEAGGEPAWTLRVVGKGGKVRQVPLTGRVVRLIADHLYYKGVLDVTSADEGGFSRLDPELPLLSSLADPMRPMAPARVYELVKAALLACADSLETTAPHAARRIRRASPHWLRHTHGRKFVEAGGDRGALRDNLGHASLATTGIYDRSDVRRRRKEMEKAFG
jgi:site-specific recombinase XerC